MKIAPMVTKESLLLAVLVAFIAGFLTGATVAVYKLAPAPSPGTGQPGASTVAPPADQSAEAISNLEAAVAAKPNDMEAWTKLGHLYYDTNQPQKAITAYQRSLELNPANPNVLTDLGVMQRNAGQPAEAIKSFTKAIQFDPTHQPARLNMGIVLLYDLHDSKGAQAIWQELLTMNPDATTADGQPLKTFVEEIRKGQEKSN